MTPYKQTLKIDQILRHHSTHQQNSNMQAIEQKKELTSKRKIKG